MRWRSTSGARSRTSSAITWPRPRSSASARAACDEADRPARAGAELDRRRSSSCEAVLAGVARGVGERDGVGDHVAVDEHVGARPASSARGPGRRGARAPRASGLQRAADDRGLLAHARVVDEQLEQEAVDLRLGQRVGALGLDRVLRRQHEERLAAPGRSGPPIVTWRSCMTSSRADCTFAGARLISSARTKLPNTGPSSMSNEPVSGRKTRVPTRSAGTQIGRELHAPERAAEHAGQRADGEGLGQAGNALEQHVTAGRAARRAAARASRPGRRSPASSRRARPRAPRGAPRRRQRPAPRAGRSWSRSPRTGIRWSRDQGDLCSIKSG